MKIGKKVKMKEEITNMSNPEQVKVQIKELIEKLTALQNKVREAENEMPLHNNEAHEHLARAVECLTKLLSM